jgi:hypothetical protein
MGSQARMGEMALMVRIQRSPVLWVPWAIPVLMERTVNQGQTVKTVLQISLKRYGQN